MTEAEIEAILAAANTLRELIFAALPLDETAKPDTALEMGFSLGQLRALEFLLLRDKRAKRDP